MNQDPPRAALTRIGSDFSRSATPVSPLRVDRPAGPLILYRVAGETPATAALWTADLETAARLGATQWAQVEPERLLVYCAARNQWLVDTRGLVIASIEDARQARPAAATPASAPGAERQRPAADEPRPISGESRLAERRTALSEHRQRLDAALPPLGSMMIPASA